MFAFLTFSENANEIKITKHSYKIMNEIFYVNHKQGVQNEQFYH